MELKKKQSLFGFQFKMFVKWRSEWFFYNIKIMPTVEIKFQYNKHLKKIYLLSLRKQKSRQIKFTFKNELL